jgi:heptosyltransferase-2
VFLTTPAGAEIAKAFPRLINEVIIFDKRKEHSGIKGLISMIRKIRDIQAGTILSVHQSFRTGLLLALSKIPIRIGYAGASLSFMLTDRFSYQKGVHEIERQRILLKGIDPETLPLQHPQRGNVLRTTLARQYTHYTEPTIVIAPGSVWETKKWPTHHFKELITILLKQTTHTISLIGSQQDAEVCASIIPNDHKGRVLNLAGTMSLDSTILHLHHSALLIANDSAPIHLASLVNCPTIAIFGPTHPQFGFSPLSELSIIMHTDLACRPCSIHGQHTCPLGTHACMKEILPSQIAEQALKFLVSHA